MTLKPENRGPWRIALISSVVLVLELALIRQIPAEVRAISYFTNLILMAAFFGLGLGCILQRQRSVAWTLPVGLLLTTAFVHFGRGVVIYSGSESVHYWLGKADAANPTLQIPMVPAAVFSFLFAALPFLALGQRLAREMDEHPRLVAYGWDIGGSLAGTLIFVVSSWLQLPPWIWPPVLMLLWAWLFVDRAAARLLCLAAGVSFVSFAWSPLDGQWSPYYFVQHAQEHGGLRVWVNSSFHQFALDFRERSKEAQELQDVMKRKWGLPYEMYRSLNGRWPEKVLVLGAGTGNDVNIALQNRAQEVTAVEIDPTILDLGRRLNSTRPFDDPRVRTVVDDARHFLRSSEQRYDLIVFGTLDSQTLLSSQANLRMENYVYTREALEDARGLLADRGVTAIYYSVYKQWLYSRIYSTVRAAFGDQSRIFFNEDPFLFNTVILATRDVESFRDTPENVELYGQGRASTDDWPFIYLERPTVSPVYVQLFAVILSLIVGAFVVLGRIHRVRGLYVNYLLLGLGFTLMESSAIVRLALLFGSTWTINAIVFSAALSTIFVANLSVLKRKAPPIGAAWIGLCVLIVINLLLPVPWLLAFGTIPRILASGLLIGLPIYFAAVCFSHLFAKERTTGYALGINLVGAMAGGPVEYLSMLIGMRGVWLVVLMVYGLAWLTTRLARR